MSEPASPERRAEHQARMAEVRANLNKPWPDPWSNVAGVSWVDAPTPPRWHRCTPWSTGHVLAPIDRCACGAIRYGGSWMERNSKRRENRRRWRELRDQPAKVWR